MNQADRFAVLWLLAFISSHWNVSCQNHLLTNRKKSLIVFSKPEPQNALAKGIREKFDKNPVPTNMQTWKKRGRSLDQT